MQVVDDLNNSSNNYELRYFSKINYLTLFYVLIVLYRNLSPIKKLRKKSRYSIEYRSKVLCYYSDKEKNFTKCAEKFGVERRLISKWWKNRDKIDKVKLKRSRFKLKSEKNHAKFPILEVQLFNWITEIRKTGGCVSGCAIQQKAIELYKDIYEKSNDAIIEFKGSNGWFRNFCKRKDLALRRITTKGREPPKDAVSTIKKFFSTCQNIVNTTSFDERTIINMDETSIYLDFPSNYTFEKKGSKRVPATTTGSERTRLSAAFSAPASGEKLPILILIPRKKDLPNFTPPENVVLIYKSGGTFNDSVINEYLEKVIKCYKDKNNLASINLFFDSARCHLTKSVDEKANEINVQKIIIPPRLTNLLQPADVCWFGNLKKQYHNYWNQWFINEEKTFTRNDNAKSPGYAKCIEWLSKMWYDFDITQIKNSFHACGI